MLPALHVPPSCHCHVTGCFPGSFLHLCVVPPPPPSLLSFFFNERLKIRLTEVTGCVSHPPARCCGGLGGQWALCGEAVSMVGTLRGGGTVTPQFHQGTRLTWRVRGHPCGGATAPGHLVATGHCVSMAWPPLQVTSPAWVTLSAWAWLPPQDTSPPQAIMFQSQATSPPQSTVSPWHGHHPSPPCPQATSPQPSCRARMASMLPGGSSTLCMGTTHQVTLGQQHPMDGDNTPGDPGRRPQGAPCPCPQHLQEGVQCGPPSRLHPPGGGQLISKPSKGHVWDRRRGKARR